MNIFCYSSSLCNGSALGDNALPSLLQLADNLQVGDRAERDTIIESLTDERVGPNENKG